MPDPVIPPAGDSPATPPAAPPPVAPWYQGADAETLGHIQNRGWQDKPANEVALAAITAHRQAEKFIGVPADHIARIPTDPADEAGWTALWTKLGAPTDATKYDFTGVKMADGGDVGDDFRDFMRTKIAAATHMPAAMATQVAQAITAYVESKVTASSAESTAARVESEKALAQNWGANAEANKFVANQAIAKLGVSPELLAAMQGADYAGTMEHFRKIGTQIGEDKFISNQNPAIPGVMTREQAVARKAELMADTAWAARYMAGGAPENRELQALLTLIVA